MPKDFVFWVLFGGRSHFVRRKDELVQASPTRGEKIKLFSLVQAPSLMGGVISDFILQPLVGYLSPSS
ncbi:hypothetical protein [Fortiea contorta]|uniref:hypothetical protein n=1 Tax=Fortiea contorta TaxID=1892405 RepID=UPI00034CD75A|nr:hypothetical protein [Fortiea contorta]